MKWGYKTVHFALKKEGLLGSGFLDESEVEQELNEYGLGGWDLVSVLEVVDGIIVFFKQPLGRPESRSTPVGVPAAVPVESRPAPAAARQQRAEPDSTWDAGAARREPEPEPEPEPESRSQTAAAEPEILEAPEPGPEEPGGGQSGDLGAIKIE